jgi:hypothetical protein
MAVIAAIPKAIKVAVDIIGKTDRDYSAVRIIGGLLLHSSFTVNSLAR